MVLEVSVRHHLVASPEIFCRVFESQQSQRRLVWTQGLEAGCYGCPCYLESAKEALYLPYSATDRAYVRCIAIRFTDTLVRFCWYTDAGVPIRAVLTLALFIFLVERSIILDPVEEGYGKDHSL